MNASESDQPKALVVGDENFSGYFLKKILKEQGCEVVTEAEAGALAKVDYVFALSGITLEKIGQLVGLAQRFSAKILLTTTADNEAFSPDSSRVDFRVIRLGLVYGPRMAKEAWKKLAVDTAPFTVKPIFITDAIYGLIKAMFAAGTRGKTFSLLAKNSQLGWEPKVETDEGLSRTKDWFEKNQPKVERIKAKASAFPLLPVLLLLIVVMAYPFVSLGVWGLWGARNLNDAYVSALKADFKGARDSAQTANESLLRVKENLSGLAAIAGFFGQEKLLDRPAELVDLARQLTFGMVNLGNTAEKGVQLSRFIFQNQPLDAQKTIAEIKIELDQAYEKLSLGETGAKNQPFYLVRDKLVYAEIVKVRDLVAQARNGVGLLPDLIGLPSGRKVYLVLFQNNMELRPTGGFIGSYGLVTFHQGRLVDFEVQDVYWADGQLKGHVEPPPDLKKYLGEAGWFLRDANWDPDFPASAAKAAWFLEKETGRTVDGVMALNLKVVAKILEATGEIQVPDFGEKITAQNLFEKAEYYSEVNFFPGSTQKQDFLGALGKNLLMTLKETSPAVLAGLVQSTYRSLRTKDLLIWLTDPKAAGLLAGFGWDGSLKKLTTNNSPASQRGKQFETINDYLMVVEANVGVNKANFFVSRRLAHQVKLNADGNFEEILQLDYKNAALSEVAPGGSYKNYLRLYLPRQSEPLAVTLKNPKTGETKLLDKKDWEIKEDHQRTVLGFLVEVPVQQSRQVEVSYRLAAKLADQTGYYRLLVQKQSGLEDEDFQLRFEPPPGVTIFSAQPAPMTSTKGIVFNQKFDQDLQFEIGLAK